MTKNCEKFEKFEPRSHLQDYVYPDDLTQLTYQVIKKVGNGKKELARSLFLYRKPDEKHLLLLSPFFFFLHLALQLILQLVLNFLTFVLFYSRHIIESSFSKIPAGVLRQRKKLSILYVLHVSRFTFFSKPLRKRAAIKTSSVILMINDLY